MRVSSTRIVIGLFSVLTIGIVLMSFSSNPPNSRTGAPGESNCGSCHGGGSGNGVLEFNFPSELIPGQTYPIEVSFSGTSTPNHGFEVTVINENNRSEGQFLGGLGTSVSVAGNKTYIKHANKNNNSWTFDWTVPESASGTYTIYGCAVAANGNGSTSGDYTRLANASATVQDIGGETPEIVVTKDVACVQETIEFEYSGDPANSYSWDFGPNAFPQTANGAGPISVRFESSGEQSVQLLADFGTEVSTINKEVSIRGELFEDGQILGPQEFCSNSTQQFEFQVNGDYDSIIWTAPGAFISPVPGTKATRVNIQFATFQGSVSATPINTCGQGNQVSLPYSFIPNIPQVNIISTVGSQICSNNSVVFEADTVNPDYSYTWKVPNGYQIDGFPAKGKALISVGSTDGIIELEITDQCNKVKTVSFAVDLQLEPEPVTDLILPGLLNCSGDTVTVNVFGGASNVDSFVWNIDGAEEVFPSNSPEITFIVGFSDVRIEVRGYNSCGLSNPYSEVLSSGGDVPGLPQSISVTGNQCEEVEFSVSAINTPRANSFIWQLPNGVEFASAQNGSSILVISEGETDSFIKVRGINSCGIGLQDSVRIEVLPIPEQPSLSQIPNTLCDNSKAQVCIENYRQAFGVSQVNVFPNSSGSSDQIDQACFDLTVSDTAQFSIQFQNACGVSPVSEFTINSLGIPDIIEFGFTDSSVLCIGEIIDLVPITNYPFDSISIFDVEGFQSSEANFEVIENEFQYSVYLSNVCGDTNYTSPLGESFQWEKANARLDELMPVCIGEVFELKALAQADNFIANWNWYPESALTVQSQTEESIVVRRNEIIDSVEFQLINPCATSDVYSVIPDQLDQPLEVEIQSTELGDCYEVLLPDTLFISASNFQSFEISNIPVIEKATTFAIVNPLVTTEASIEITSIDGCAQNYLFNVRIQEQPEQFRLFVNSEGLLSVEEGLEIDSILFWEFNEEVIDGSEGRTEIENLGLGTYKVIAIINGCEVSSFPLTYTSTQSLESKVIIYPNPVSTILFIQGEIQGQNIRLYNSLGRQMKFIVEDSQEGIKINLSDIPSGPYLIQVGNQARTIVKQ